MDDSRRTSASIEEISIFCPVRLHFGGRRFDGVMDTLDSRGGTFYILTEEEPPHLGTEGRLALQRERRMDLVLGEGLAALRIPCRVRGMHFDEDGLFVYVGLCFLSQDAEAKKRLDGFIGALW